MTPGEQEWAAVELGVADEALQAASMLLDQRLLRDAASRLHYAVFHAGRAALAVRGVHAKTHSGQITQFIEIFGPAPLLGKLLNLRARADYSRKPFEERGEDLAPLLGEASAFLARCREVVASAGEPDEPDDPPDW